MEDFGHNFERKESINGFRWNSLYYFKCPNTRFNNVKFHICKNCKLKVSIGYNSILYEVNHIGYLEFKPLDISCNEMQIKNMLE